MPGKSSTRSATPARVGRPRASGRSPNIDSEEDILRAAAKLFAERGFAGTSTRQIANVAGLGQSAIFHWFPTKEAILDRLFSRGWDRSLEYFERISNGNISGAVKLCLCVTYDARLVAGAEPYIQVMIVPPELRQPKFKRLLLKRQRLIAYLEDSIRQGIDEGDFRKVDQNAAAHMVLAIDEVALDAARPRTPLSPQQHATRVVDFVLNALMADRSRIPKILRAVVDQSRPIANVPAP